MKYILCGILYTITAFAQPYKGDITGFVIDAKTQEPIPVVNIQVVEQPTFGTVTDASGNFNIKGIEVGTYNLKATLVGYEAIILTNIVVSTGRSTKVSIKLSEQAVQVGGVTVSATYFSRNNELSPLSVNNYDRSEVKRQPGSVQDVQRVVQNLPGVASSNDNMNELIVRGGSPSENLTVMESMEIPSINHYPNEFNSAGPINMINIDHPGKIADFIASILNIDKNDQQKILEMTDVRERMEKVLIFIKKEQELLKIQKRVQQEINEKIEKSQREYFLKEELKAIKGELV